jgi:hypothetical protein
LKKEIFEGFEAEGRHLKTETSQDRSRGNSRPKSDMKGSHLKEIRIVDKENMRLNGPGEVSEMPEMKGKMNGFFQLWSQVTELIRDFNGLGKQYEKVNLQIEKDRKRMDQLSQKKADLLPYMKEISRILANPNSDSLRKNLIELEEAEAENINKSTRYFEKLLEEFGFLYNTMTDKLKVKKADYVKWNKKLAGYCQANYPQLHN